MFGVQCLDRTMQFVMLCSYAGQYVNAVIINRVQQTELLHFARHQDMLGHNGPCSVGPVSMFISVRTGTITTGGAVRQQPCTYITVKGALLCLSPKKISEHA
jgi:hypothetical protein